VNVRSLDDSSLLKAYVAGDGSAFVEIVRRHGGLVYSAALRQTRDVHLAQDVTQAVFMLLSKKARGLGAFVILSAWLYRAACYAARDVMKKERRRRLHEKRASVSETSWTASGTDEVWVEMGPLLDDAMRVLREKDRTAVLLRFFEGRSLREVGAATGTSEAAAGQRVSRAIERLRRFFIARGITASVAAIELSIARYAISPMPANLDLAVTTQAAGANALITSIAKGASHMIFWSKIKLPAVVTAIIILAIAAPMIVLQARGQSPPAQAATPGSSNQPYQVAMPGGGRFELCLADIDVGGTRMWNPDGILLAPPPFDLVIEKRVQEAKPKQGEWRIAAMMRMVDAAGNKVPGSFSAGHAVHSFGVGGATVEKNGKPLDGWEVEVATVDARQSSFVLQTGWAIGEWHRLATWDGIGFQYKLLTDDRNWQIQPGLPNAINGSILVPIALQFPHITDWDERYFAVLTNGTRVPASTSLGMRLMNGVGMTAFRFDPEKSLKPSDVKSYEMEVLGLTRIVMTLPPTPSSYRKANIQILPPYPLPKMTAETH
jgi:RNA polymerase sigma factor (sigma-70 family)